jgi:cytochrome oxidase Cu insertion factor (SCO1/SenC/PrrC family)
VLNRYKKEKKMEGNWALVTGSPDVLGKLFFDSFHVAAIPMKEGSKAENMTHSSHLIAVDGKGQIRGYFDAMDETKTNDLNALLKSLLRGN